MDKPRYILTPKPKDPLKEEPRKKNRVVLYGLIVGLFIIAIFVGAFIVKSLTDSSENELKCFTYGEKSFFNARIGDQEITMELTKNDESVDGRYFYHDFGRWINLEGTISEDGSLKITEKYRSQETGSFVFKMSENGDEFHGIWNDPDNIRSKILKGNCAVGIQPELMRRTILHIQNQNKKEIDKVMWMWSEKSKRLYSMLNPPSKDKIKAAILNSWKNQIRFRNIVKKVKWIRENTIAVNLDYEYVLASTPNETINKESTVVFEFDSLQFIESEYAENTLNSDVF